VIYLSVADGFRYTLKSRLVSLHLISASKKHNTFCCSISYVNFMVLWRRFIITNNRSIVFVFIKQNMSSTYLIQIRGKIFSFDSLVSNSAMKRFTEKGDSALPMLEPNVFFIEAAKFEKIEIKRAIISFQNTILLIMSLARLIKFIHFFWSCLQRETSFT
jgi:hypothetical protein